VTRCKRITGSAAVCECERSLSFKTTRPFSSVATDYISHLRFFEGSIALIFDAYLFTLVLDLWPSGKTSPRYLRRLELWEQKGSQRSGVSNGEHVEGGRIHAGECRMSLAADGEPMREVR